MPKPTKLSTKPISTYSSDEAVEDGILFEVKELGAKFEKGFLSHITTNLLSKGYMNEKSINLPNVMNLLHQSQKIVIKTSNHLENFNSFYEGNIELPSGQQQKIFIELNETGKFTVLLPEDH